MKKAFTLIELLAVIIVLAVVALIATPIVLDVVDDARTSAAKSETAMIVSGINAYCAASEMKAQLNGTKGECADGVTKEDVPKMVDLGNAKVLEIEFSNKNTNEVAFLAYTGNAKVTDKEYNGRVTKLIVESNTKIVEYNGSTYKIDGKEIEKPEKPNSPTVYKDNSGANYPELLDNMVPVKYNGTTWVYADIYQEWYDYDAKEWANAVVLNSGVTKTVGDTISEEEIALMYVWIPRYTYTIFNGNNENISVQQINVKFESETNSSGTVTCTDMINQTDANGNLISEICFDKNGDGSIVNGTSTYTHPAFTFGDDEIEGFWVGKFEISGTTDAITIKPNVDSLKYKTISTYFTAIQNMTNTYGINGDSHMIKNMEWGAIAYLKQSQYGLGTTDIGINNYKDTNSDGTYTLKTGCGAPAGSSSSTICNAYNAGGTVASTTGNVYGVYDMSGGQAEYVMGNMVDSSGEFYSSDAGYVTAPNSKYYNNYTYNETNTAYTRGKLGDATKETLVTLGTNSGGWNDDNSNLPYTKHTWFQRGGFYMSGENAGIFSFGCSTGLDDGHATRAVLVKPLISPENSK